MGHFGCHLDWMWSWLGGKPLGSWKGLSWSVWWPHLQLTETQVAEHTREAWGNFFFFGLAPLRWETHLKVAAPFWWQPTQRARRKEALALRLLAPPPHSLASPFPRWCWLPPLLWDLGIHRKPTETSRLLDWSTFLILGLSSVWHSLLQQSNHSCKPLY